MQIFFYLKPVLIFLALQPLFFCLIARATQLMSQVFFRLLYILFLPVLLYRLVKLCCLTESLMKSWHGTRERNVSFSYQLSRHEFYFALYKLYKKKNNEKKNEVNVFQVFVPLYKLLAISQPSRLIRSVWKTFRAKSVSQQAKLYVVRPTTTAYSKHLPTLAPQNVPLPIC